MMESDTAENSDQMDQPSTKTKKRNKIGSESLNAVCVTRFSSDNCCQSFKVTSEHLKLMSQKNLYSKD
ncbi:unnamed protein product [Acanthoscelides obtectus]|uniref:Uncharacterized protein n=1 Tax=Acanthoscelides obtectus TaxID=200917 RepID=A0A9P0PG39_ACAOB|nr:unnamed protein product [Acanthoscelides obtectus]CAK1677107.1 hypothetical protein AOBTE_LOCUS31114 [Acanthoscelides obtectus]